MNLKHKVLTGNPTGDSRCQALTSRALNTSCYFGQSARSIESRCVVIYETRSLSSLCHQTVLGHWQVVQPSRQSCTCFCEICSVIPIHLLDKMRSLKMAVEISRNLATIWVLNYKISLSALVARPC